MNVEASLEAMDELTTIFRYNDAVIRNLVIKMDEADTSESLIMKAEKESREHKNRYEERRAAEAEAESNDDEDQDDSDEDADDKDAE